MLWKKWTSSLFAEFLSLRRCHVGHVLDAALEKTNWRARTTETRERDGAFGWLSEIRTSIKKAENTFTLLKVTYCSFKITLKQHKWQTTIVRAQMILKESMLVDHVGCSFPYSHINCFNWPLLVFSQPNDATFTYYELTLALQEFPVLMTGFIVILNYVCKHINNICVIAILANNLIISFELTVVII